MEPSQGQIKRTVWLGEFEVVDVTAIAIVVHLGSGVHVHVPTALNPHHQTKRGDKLPLYAELPYGKA